MSKSKPALHANNYSDYVCEPAERGPANAWLIGLVKIVRLTLSGALLFVAIGGVITGIFGATPSVSIDLLIALAGVIVTLTVLNLDM
ncbi:MAG: hypothetical protein ACLPOA_09825 [Methylocella sp.]